MLGHLLYLIFLLGISQSLDIPLQSALLLRGEPVGFSEPVRRHKRAEVETPTPPHCSDDEYRPTGVNHCCKKCFSGYKRVSDCLEKGQVTKCEKCQAGQYYDKPNFAKQCKRCSRCTPSLGQVMLSPCSAEKNTVCGCPSGQFQTLAGTTFKCQNCSHCVNGKKLFPCHGYNDTICTCHHGFFLDPTNRICQNCTLCDNERCRDHCPPLIVETIKARPPADNPMLYVSIVVAPLCIAITVFAVICYLHKKRSGQVVESDSTHQTIRLVDQTTTSENLAIPTQVRDHQERKSHLERLIPNQSLPLPDVTSEPRAQQFQTAAELYIVIDNIPVLRWKEFVRRLGLNDNDIAHSERDNRYRDAQYDMLSTWKNRVGPTGATRDVVSRVLRDMDLGGCVERILESL
ncbi:tumor necrosis factor receptor superfamily member 1A [Pelodytes ibericus]